MLLVLGAEGRGVDAAEIKFVCSSFNKLST